jgi:hypothetical protein
MRRLCVSRDVFAERLARRGLADQLGVALAAVEIARCRPQLGLGDCGAAPRRRASSEPPHRRNGRSQRSHATPPGRPRELSAGRALGRDCRAATSRAAEDSRELDAAASRASRMPVNCALRKVRSWRDVLRGVQSRRSTSWLHMNLPLYSPSAPSGGGSRAEAARHSRRRRRAGRGRCGWRCGVRRPPSRSFPGGPRLGRGAHSHSASVGAGARPARASASGSRGRRGRARRTPTPSVVLAAPRRPPPSRGRLPAVSLHGGPAVGNQSAGRR